MKINLKSDKVYILPTRVGTLFFITSIVLMAIGLTYANNLIILNAIVLLTLFTFSTIITHFNLEGVTLSKLEINNCYSDLPIIIKGSLINISSRSQQNISMRIELNNKKYLYVNGLNVSGKTSLTFEEFSLHLPRGRYDIQKIILFSSYPFGIFRSWLYPKNQEKNLSFYIYPQAFGDVHLSHYKEQFNHDLSAGQIVDINEFLHHEQYIEGTSQSKVDWKLYAKRNELMTKKFSFVQLKQGYNIQLTPSAQTLEEDLMKVSKLISLCYRYKMIWKLSTPNLTTPFHFGMDHYQKCMQELAIYDQ